jgi:hypothetical protein
VTLETIIGGNARFNRVSDNLPSFEIRAEWLSIIAYCPTPAQSSSIVKI